MGTRKQALGGELISLSATKQRLYLVFVACAMRLVTLSSSRVFGYNIAGIFRAYRTIALALFASRRPLPHKLCVYSSGRCRHHRIALNTARLCAWVASPCVAPKRRYELMSTKLMRVMAYNDVWRQTTGQVRALIARCVWVNNSARGRASSKRQAAFSSGKPIVSVCLSCLSSYVWPRWVICLCLSLSSAIVYRRSRHNMASLR